MGLPLWYLILQLLFTLAIGVGGGLIAWAQWRTANQKVALDIFDRRFRFYDGLRRLNQSVLGGAKVTDGQIMELIAYWQESRFLFGQEITELLKPLKDFYSAVDVTNLELEGQRDPDRRKVLLAERRSALKGIEAVQIALPDAFLPFMRMDTKVIRSPSQWYKDVQKRRLSSGDLG